MTGTGRTKQSEVFAFLAMFFLVGVALVERRVGHVREALRAAETARHEAEEARRQAEEAKRKAEEAERKAREAAKAFPPIVKLSEEDTKFRFDSGSAALSATFRAAIRTEVAPLISKLSADCRCDLMEVVGHTDEVRVDGASTLDDKLVAAVAHGRTRGLSAGSNIDLGMMRAAAIVSELSDYRDSLFPTVRRMIPLSAGQLVATSGAIITETGYANDRSRRRIEIRLTRSRPPVQHSQGWNMSERHACTALDGATSLDPTMDFTYLRMTTDGVE